MNLTTGQHIIFDMEDSTRGETLHVLAETVFRKGRASNTDTSFQELHKRERECTTDFGEGIVTPHTHHACIKETGIPFVRMKHKIEWRSIDEKLVEAAACLFAPDDRNNFHLRASSKLTRRLMHEDFVDMLKTVREQQVLDEIIDTVS